MNNRTGRLIDKGTIFELPCNQHYVVENGRLRGWVTPPYRINVPYAYDVFSSGDERGLTPAEERKLTLKLWKWVGEQLGYEIED